MTARDRWRRAYGYARATSRVMGLLVSAATRAGRGIQLTSDPLTRAYDEAVRTNDLQSFHAWAWAKFGPCTTSEGIAKTLTTDRFTVTRLTWPLLKSAALALDASPPAYPDAVQP